MALRISTLCSMLCAATLLAPEVGRACAGGDEGEVELSSFFASGLLGDARWRPFLYSAHRFYEGAGQGPADLTRENLAEWSTFFGGKVSEDRWSDLLYAAPLSRVDDLIFALKGKPGAKPADQDVALANPPDKDAMIAALFYVGFAKRVQPFATDAQVAEEWSAKPKPKPDPAVRAAAIDALFAGGLKAMASAKLPFLKQRYALQLLRLKFYQHDWAGCVAFWDQHDVDLGAPTASASWRAVAYAAGAMLKTKDTARANLLYAQVFDGFPPMAVSALWSFAPRDEADWKGSLELAGTVRQKAVLWQMLGITSDGQRALKELLALDPKSDLLSLLVVREVHRVELALGAQATPAPNSEARHSVVALLALLDPVATKGAVHDPWLWDFASAHLHALLGELELARKSLDRAEQRAPKNDVAERQLRRSRLHQLLLATKSVDAKQETVLAAELTRLKQTAEKNPEDGHDAALLSWARGYLAALYREKGDVVTALCLVDQDDPLFSDAAQLEKLRAFLEKPNKTPFEAFVAGLKAPSLDAVRTGQGLLALYTGDLAAAQQRFTSLPAVMLQADPFVGRTRDCVDCDVGDPKHKAYTVLQFIARLKELEQQASGGSAKAALEVGNGFYNISRYGNSAGLYAAPGAHFYRAPPTMKNELALEYYAKAFDLSKDRELKARAAFMAAKCELNEFYNQRADNETADFRAGAWFQVLATQYADTRFEKEVLKECGYFRTYVKARRGK